MATATETRAPRLGAVLREGERVTPLELFFDLVFVLAITQCTALMSNDPTWGGLAQGLLVLGVLWWSWTGYAWLTSVVDPEEGAVRIAIFGAMAALLIVAICVPEAFDSLGLEFALAYGAVRAGHIALFVLASRDDAALRQSVIGLAASTAIGVGLLAGASAVDGLAQAALWAGALGLDMGGPFLFGAHGWKIVLVALGLKKTLGQVDDPLDTVPAFALLGGVSFYLLGLVGFRLRHVHTINRQRLLLALVLFALLPAATELPALATVAIVAALLCAMITYETISYGEGRTEVRHGLASGHPSS